ncbi:hypothetical protein C2G38_2087590 [Gigaspora rosea]|uniref:Uncharacterized protein n=1 Tax=Gigaspora rosea TaxID=44941 RepID=A0A397V7U8_9GLOM|nr:hypothetical protein C2G38_2087590 [Gigaspora rosea]
MMTSKEALQLYIKWDFVNSLKFDEQLEYEEAYFIKMNYISMLKKIYHADELYTQCLFKECLEVTTNVSSYSHCVSPRVA